jgi:2-phospho-L-lactate transferase/gluconeogenesis factor (CofD/UPF0052 family)/phosphoglycolate phosphatase-like HAD superfamily hydrolase
MSSRLPRIVLFSGGSASQALAADLEKTGAEIINVVAVFDNGGSTGELRRISPFPMPAIGDIRKRLISLAPTATELQQTLKKLFDGRFSIRKSEKQLRDELHNMATPKHPLVAELPLKVQGQILETLQYAIQALPVEFSLHELSVGNLLMFGRMLQTHDYLQAIDWARNLLQVKSRVLPVTLDSVHLGALCEGEQWVRGQAALTEETCSLPGRVERICFLEQEGTHAFGAKAQICPAVADAMESADLFLIGFGSFLTSILPHFLVRGVGAAFTRRAIPKVFLVNPTIDKETQQFTVASMVDTINKYACLDKSAAAEKPAITQVLHFGSHKETHIPAGNMSSFSGEYVDLSEISGFDQMSARAAEVVAASVGLEVGPRPGRPTLRPRAVVLFDLDATLFDYPKVRMDATAKALEGMVSDPKLVSRELFAMLRHSLADLLVGLGFEDLRRGWDSPEVPVVACLLDDPTSRAGLQALAELARTTGSSEEDVSFTRRMLSYQRAAHLRSINDVNLLLQKAADIRSLWKTGLGERSSVFRQYVESNAVLMPGASELIAQSVDSGAEVHVVSEGDSTVQRFKFDSLRLADWVQACIVTDVTCGILPVLDELFLQYKDKEISQVPLSVVELYDQLVPLTVKSQAFYTKLLHAIRQSAGENLKDQMQSFHFLTPEDWQSASAYYLVMIGDRYRKDLEPLLQVCPSGLQTFRVVTGRYYREDPFHEIIDQGRPTPTSFVRDLPSLTLPLAATLRNFHEQVRRPTPVLPSPTIIEAALQSCPGLSESGTRVLRELRSEALRHLEVHHETAH